MNASVKENQKSTNKRRKLKKSNVAKKLSSTKVIDIEEKDESGIDDKSFVPKKNLLVGRLCKLKNKKCKGT